jgi:VanZ family protein
VAYAVLAVLVARGLADRWRRAVTPKMAWLTVLIATLYGVTDEYHQTFVPSRSAEGLDVVADAVGAFAGAGAAWAWGYTSSRAKSHVIREPHPHPRGAGGDRHDQPAGRPQRAERSDH